MRRVTTLCAAALCLSCARGGSGVRVSQVISCQERAEASTAQGPRTAQGVDYNWSPPTDAANPACREVPYDSARGPRLFDVTTSSAGWLGFTSELPFGRGERFAVVRDVEQDAPVERLPFELSVVEAKKSDEGPEFEVELSLPAGFFAPSRVVGPLEGGWAHLPGKSGDGESTSLAEIGKPQLLYEVWLDNAILQDVAVRCSKTVYVSQTWIVTDQRVCIRSAFQSY
jgi:hypothetical protein